MIRDERQYRGDIIVLRNEINISNQTYYTNTYMVKYNALLFKRKDGIFVDLETNKKYNSFDRDNKSTYFINTPLVDISSLREVKENKIKEEKSLIKRLFNR